MSNIVPHSVSGGVSSNSSNYLVPSYVPNQNPSTLNFASMAVRGVAELGYNLVEQVDVVKTEYKARKIQRVCAEKQQREIAQSIYENNLLDQDAFVAGMLSQKVAYAKFQHDRGYLEDEDFDFVRRQAEAVRQRRVKRGFEL